MADTRECPSCGLEIAPDVEECPYCSYELPKRPPGRVWAGIAMAVLLLMWLLSTAF